MTKRFQCVACDTCHITYDAALNCCNPFKDLRSGKWTCAVCGKSHGSHTNEDRDNQCMAKADKCCERVKDLHEEWK